MSKQHTLKIHPKPLAELLSGAKTCEIRFNDRDFEVGDTVRLQEINPVTEQFTGRPDFVRVVTHVQKEYGLPDHLCVLSYAAPAVAHGDAAVHKDAERYRHLRSITEGLDTTVDAMIAEATAMRAQAGVHGVTGVQVAKYRERSNHDVIRSDQSQPCYCWADNDHRMGREVGQPVVSGFDSRTQVRIKNITHEPDLFYVQFPNGQTAHPHVFGSRSSAETWARENGYGIVSK